MDRKEIELAAYEAAHRILTANTNAPELACPGARRSHAVDMVANIIKDVFGPYDESVSVRRRVGVLFEIQRSPS